MKIKLTTRLEVAFYLSLAAAFGLTMLVKDHLTVFESLVVLVLSTFLIYIPVRDQLMEQE